MGYKNQMSGFSYLGIGGQRLLKETNKFVKIAAHLIIFILFYDHAFVCITMVRLRDSYAYNDYCVLLRMTGKVLKNTEPNL